MASRAFDQSQQFRSKRRATVPELYRKAALILKSAEERKGSLKNLVYSSGFRDIKPLYALVAESCKHQNALDELIKNPGLQNVQPFNPHLAKILLTELLWGKGYLKPENARAIRIILELENDFRQSLSCMKLPQENESVHQVSVPRYVRVNTLVSTVENVCNHLINEGWKQIKSKKKRGYDAFIEKVKSLNEDEFMLDFHLDFLLVFHPNAQFQDHELLHNGSILLQDKASCLPAVALNDGEFTGKILDACSAPGMKTSLLAAISNNQTPIIAIEQNFKRCSTLKQILSNARASQVTVRCTDFLNVDPTDHQDVKYILVDPSCSGTGMVKRFNLETKQSEAEFQARLEKLCNLQCMLVEHAASFSGVERIVYSTCSIHEEENESVVQKVLAKIGNSFKLEEALPWWPRRGLDRYDTSENTIGRNCVRAETEKDLTNGFFVSLFVRR